jgi:hypothetical protein
MVLMAPGYAIVVKAPFLYRNPEELPVEGLVQYPTTLSPRESIPVTEVE